MKAEFFNYVLRTTLYVLDASTDHIKVLEETDSPRKTNAMVTPTALLTPTAVLLTSRIKKTKS